MATLHDKDQRDFRLYKSSSSNPPMNFNKIVVGGKTLRDDVTAILDSNYLYKRKNRRRYTKDEVMRALDNGNIKALRKMSNYFYDTNGIYKNLCLYMAHLYKYDWFITPHVYDKNIKPEKVIEG